MIVARVFSENKNPCMELPFDFVIDFFIFVSGEIYNHFTYEAYEKKLHPYNH